MFLDLSMLPTGMLNIWTVPPTPPFKAFLDQISSSPFNTNAVQVNFAVDAATLNIRRLQ